MDINVRIDNYIFNSRAVGIIIDNNRILFQKKVNDKYWALPGGKIKVFETGEDAIKRELMEELGIDECSVVRMHSISENFFEFSGDKYHQYIFSYIVNISKDSYIYENDVFNSKEEKDLIYRWFNLDMLDSSLIKPD